MCQSMCPWGHLPWALPAAGQELSPPWWELWPPVERCWELGSGNQALAALGNMNLSFFWHVTGFRFTAPHFLPRRTVNICAASLSSPNIWKSALKECLCKNWLENMEQWYCWSCCRRVPCSSSSPPPYHQAWAKLPFQEMQRFTLKISICFNILSLPDGLWNSFKFIVSAATIAWALM